MVSICQPLFLKRALADIADERAGAALLGVDEPRAVADSHHTTCTSRRQLLLPPPASSSIDRVDDPNLVSSEEAIVAPALLDHGLTAAES